MDKMIYESVSICDNRTLKLKTSKGEFNIPVTDGLTMIRDIISILEESLGKEEEANSYNPKDGDFITIKTANHNTWVCIFKEIDGKNIYNYADFRITDNETHRINIDCVSLCQIDLIENIRSSTDGEKNLLLSKLEGIGKKWNEEKKIMEDIWTPKDGDFVTYTYTQTNNIPYKVIMIYHFFDGVSAFNYLSYNSFDKSVMSHKNPMNQRFCKVSDLKPATEEEKKLLLDESHKAGLDWDVDKKEVVEYKWKPEYSESFWTVWFSNVTKEFMPEKNIWTGSDTDINTLDKGWAFKAQGEANELAKSLNNKINQEQMI